MTLTVFVCFKVFDRRILIHLNSNVQNLRSCQFKILRYPRIPLCIQGYLEFLNLKFLKIWTIELRQSIRILTLKTLKTKYS